MHPEKPSDKAPVAIYGGSFDPVHRGHLAVARRAQEAFSLGKVWFVPAARPPHKPGKRLASGRDRVAMLELALVDCPWAQVDARELSREGPSYTHATVVELLAEDPSLVGRLHLILGGDNLPGLPGWYQAEALLEAVQPIVLRRVGDGEDPVRELQGRLPGWACEKLRKGFLDLPPVPGRASFLREAIAQGQKDLPDLPNGVENYILRRGLYAPEETLRETQQQDQRGTSDEGKNKA